MSGVTSRVATSLLQPLERVAQRSGTGVLGNISGMNQTQHKHFHSHPSNLGASGSTPKKPENETDAKKQP